MKKILVLLSLLFCGLVHADTVNINWMVGDSVYGASTCTVGGDIILPTAPTKPGYTFLGWAIGYTPIEYIETSGTQYIQTDYIGNLNSRYEGAIYVTTAGDYFYIGSRVDTGNTRHVAIGANTAKDGLYVGHGSVCKEAYRFPMVFNKKLYFVTDFYNRSKSITVDGVTSTKSIAATYDEGYVASFTNTAPLQIFFNRINGANSVASYAAPNGTRVYYLKIYYNEQLVHDLIPVLDANGVACMYDKVTGTFLYNAGTGNFVAGPAL